MYDHWHNHWIFGLVGDDTVAVSEICDSGDATVREQTTFLNGVVQVLIGFIYSPTTVTVQCAGAQEDDSLPAPQLLPAGR